MCCGSKRSGLRSGSASTPQPRAAPMSAPASARPTPRAQAVDVNRAVVFPPRRQVLVSPPQAEAAPVRTGRRWRLSS